MDNIIHDVAARLSLNEKGVSAVIKLLDEGATVPFISRYRKEATGALDEGRGYGALPAIMILASGSSPRSRAIVARVLFFGLKGAYISSTSVIERALRRDSSSLAVMAPAAVMASATNSFRVYSSRTLLSVVSTERTATSSSAPVASFL